MRARSVRSTVRSYGAFEKRAAETERYSHHALDAAKRAASKDSAVELTKANSS